ncbi:MAG: hypothetical protein Q8P54_02165 [bacterium]|nr:hypothetical protein [bacterium]
MEQDPKPKFYKTKKFWIIFLVTLIILATLGIYGWYLQRSSYSKEFIKSSWHSLASRSDKVILAKKDLNPQNVNDLSREIHNLDSLIRDEKFNAGNISTLLNDKKSLFIYRNFLEKFSNYSSQAASMSDDIKILDEEDFTKLSLLSAQARQSSDEVKNSISYLKENISSDIFNLADYLKSAKDKMDEQKAKEEAEKTQKERQMQKEASDRAEVESNINKFMDGFISGDVEKMKRYMTDAFINEFNFSTITPDARLYTYPVSFRLVGTNRLGDKYEVQVNILYKYRDATQPNSSQYTDTMVYTLIFDNKTNHWLINSQNKTLGY